MRRKTLALTGEHLFNLQLFWLLSKKTHKWRLPHKVSVLL